MNIFKYELDEAWKNEITYQQIISFNTLKQVNRTLTNAQRGEYENDDFIIRDVVFKNILPTETNKTLFDYIHDHYRPRKVNDATMVLRSLRENCQNKKLDFWRDCIKLPISDRDKLETKQIVQQIKRETILPSILLFAGGSIMISAILKLYRNPIKFQMMTLVIGTAFGYYYGVYNNSNEIFNQIPKLPDKEMENKRQDIINYCFSLDNEQEFLSIYRLMSRYILYDINLKALHNQK